MGNSTTTASSGGIGLGGAVFIVFLVLKLTGQIGWSWWWVTSPLWIPLAVALVFAAFAFLMAILTGQWPRKSRRPGWR